MTATTTTTTTRHGAALVRRLLDFDDRRGALVGVHDSQLFEPRADLLIILLRNLLDHPTAPRDMERRPFADEVRMLHKRAHGFLLHEIDTFELRCVELLLARAEADGARTIARAEREWRADLAERLRLRSPLWAGPTDDLRAALLSFTAAHVVAVLKGASL